MNRPTALTLPIDAIRRLLLVVAVIALAATVLALIALHRLADSYRFGLDTTADGAAVTGQLADSAASIAGDVATLADTTGDVLGQGEQTLRATADGLEQIATAARTNLADGLDGTATVAARAASWIETIERFIPGDSDSLAEDLREVSNGLEPAPSQLRELGTQLDETATLLRDTTAQVAALVPQVGQLSSSVAASRADLAEASRLAQAVSRRAGSERDRAELDIWLLRALSVTVGLGVTGCALWARRLLPVTGSLHGNP